jgi:hypothetical protein
LADKAKTGPNPETMTDVSPTITRVFRLNAKGLAKNANGREISEITAINYP